MSAGLPILMRRTMEAAAVSYIVFTVAALVIPPGSSFVSSAAQPIVCTLLGPASVILLGGSWSSFALASAVVAVPTGIAWAIWRYEPAIGVGLFWSTVSMLAWLACGWLAWAVSAY